MLPKASTRPATNHPDHGELPQRLVRQRADSNADSNRGEPLWSTARYGVEGVQVADAYERP